MKRLRSAIASSVALAAALVPLTASGAGPRGAIATVGLVLKKLDFSSQPNYPSDPNLYTNLDALDADVQTAQNLLTDPTAADPSVWCPFMLDVMALASGTTYYFRDTGGTNQARDEFVQDWSRAVNLARCP